MVKKVEDSHDLMKTEVIIRCHFPVIPNIRFTYIYFSLFLVICSRMGCLCLFLASSAMLKRDSYSVSSFFKVLYGWLRGTVVERWSLTSKPFLSCARPTADG